MPAHLIVAFYADKVQLVILDNLLSGLIMTDLLLQLFRSQLFVVVLNAAHVFRQPGKRLIHLLLGNGIRQTDNFRLVDMLDIDAEFILPILHAYRGAVHAQASAADQAVGRTLQGN